MQKKEDYLRTQIEELMRLYPKASFEYKVTEQYRNMKEVLLLHPQVVDYAKEAIKRAGLKVKDGKYSWWYRWQSFIIYGFALSQFICRRAGNSLEA